MFVTDKGVSLLFSEDLNISTDVLATIPAHGTQNKGTIDVYALRKTASGRKWWNDEVIAYCILSGTF